VVLSVAGVFIAAIAVSAYFYLSQKNKTAIESIAVLPFANTSGDPNMEYLSDGITESIINSLSQLPNLGVIARSSVFRYKGRDTDAPTVGRELNVRSVLTGRVVERGDNLSISVELVDVRNNHQLWGEQYNRKVTDLLAVQSEISQAISEQLRSRLSSNEQNRVNRNYTKNPEAYQLYLKGRFYLNKETAEGGRKALDYFSQAIEKDPNYALAYAGLADSYAPLPNESPNLARLKAKAAIIRALAIDDNLPEAHVAFANIKWSDWDWTGAEQEFRRAIELNPNYAPAHDGNAMLLASIGRFDEGFREIKRAQQLDPLSLIINRHVGTMFLFARQYDQALVQLKKNLDLDPGYFFTYVDLGWAYVRKGMYQEAIANFQRATDLEPENLFAIAGLGHANAQWGKKDKAQAMLARLSELSKQRFVAPYYFAIVYAGLENRDQAFAWLEKAYQEHDEFSDLKVAPMFENLHSDPRFADLVRRVGLPQ
jgi:TolB-like protein/Tfp pilus assembly protein PilF